MHVAERTWQRFALKRSSPRSFAVFASRLTGAAVFVRAGARLVRVARRASLSRLPTSGVVRYGGSSYLVGSFTAHGPARTSRIFLLVHA
jgi:hypothetical protein